MLRTVCVLLAVVALHCSPQAARGEEVVQRQLNPTELARARKIELSCTAVARVAASPASPLRLQRGGPAQRAWPYGGPSAMGLTMGGIAYLLNAGSPGLVQVSLDAQAVQGLDLPRLTQGDLVGPLVIDQTAAYSPRTGLEPAMAILIRMGATGPATHRVVGRYAYDPQWDRPVQWRHFLRLEQAFRAPELEAVETSTWGTGLSLDGEGNAYVGFMTTGKHEWRAAAFDPDGRFVRFVPSHVRDGDGYYYAPRGDEMRIYDRDEQERVRVSFPGWAGAGNLVLFPWQTVDRGVWIKISTGSDARNRAYVHVGPNGEALEWVEYDPRELRRGLHRVMLNPFFCLNRTLYYGAIQVSQTNGHEEATYVIFACPLGAAEQP